MVLNVIIDCAIGLLPIVGDLLDVAFKSNLRNLTLLESHLLERNGVCSTGSFSILIPPSDQFITPKLKSGHNSSNWKWWSREDPRAASPGQVHSGRRTRPLSAKTSQQATASVFASGAHRRSRTAPSSRVKPTDFDEDRFTELDSKEGAAAGSKSRTVPGGLDF